MNARQGNTSFVNTDPREKVDQGVPFFSIGITAYEQPELLKEALRSVLCQTFPDFEVIVGNDFPGKPLDLQNLGVSDPRIRIINNPHNLGERENMNSLLETSRGRYFTWLADDDYYMPEYLESLHRALRNFRFPNCAFTSYRIQDDTGLISDNPRTGAKGDRLLSGREFLRGYFTGDLRAIGTCGMFEKDFLQRLGGAERLGAGPFALYSEYMLIVRAGTLERIAYVDDPLVIYRIHPESWGCTNREWDEYIMAGEQLISKSIDVFRVPFLSGNFRSNLTSLCEIHRGVLISKALSETGGRFGFGSMGQLFRRAREAEGEIRGILRKSGLDPAEYMPGLGLSSLWNRSRPILFARLAYRILKIHMTESRRK